MLGCFDQDEANQLSAFIAVGKAFAVDHCHLMRLDVAPTVVDAVNARLWNFVAGAM